MNKFAEDMKRLILRKTENSEKLFKSPDAPDRKVDDIFTNMVIQWGRVKYDFQEMKRSKVLRSYSIHDNIPIERAEGLFLPTEYTKDPQLILIRGRAGIGKTLFSQMLIRDWAKGKLFSEEKNKNKCKFVFLFTFRQLNLIEKPVTLREFLSICSFCPEMTDETFHYIVKNSESILFVLDGFDEFKYRFETKDLQDVPREEKMPVAAVFARIAAGKLLTNATVVITTRSEAEKLHDCERGAEILGFTENEVKDYITKFFASQESERRVMLGHVLGNENLLTFCYVPVHCFLVCSYLKWHLAHFPTSKDAELPTKITYIYAGVLEMFLLKHHTECRAKEQPHISDFVQSTLVKLSELSLEYLKCKQFIFSNEDLRKSDVNEDEVSQLMNSGLIHCIPGCITGPFTIKTYYCFLHLTLHEFLAALCLVKTDNLLDQHSGGPSLSQTLDSLSDVVTVFVAGILGAAFKQSRLHLSDLNVTKKDAATSMDSIVNNICRKNPIQTMLFKVLYEYGDRDFVQKVLREHDPSDLELYKSTDSDCQALAFLLMTKVEAEHQVKRLNIVKGFQMSCRGVRCIVNALCSENCQLEELCFKNTGTSQLPHIDQTVMKLLSEELKNKNCHLVRLELNDMCIDDKGAEYLSGALSGSECQLRRLNLQGSQIKDKGAKHLSGALRSRECHLTVLSLFYNQISDKGAEHLSSALSSSECQLTVLELLGSQISDKGVEYLSGALRGSECQLTVLDLCENQISDKGTEYLSGALRSRECQLTMLALCENQISDKVKGTEYLSGALRSRECQLTVLDLSVNQISDEGAEYLSGALRSNECQLTDLCLDENEISDKGAEYLSGALRSRECQLTVLNLSKNQISDEGAEYLSGALSSSECQLRELYLGGNQISDEGAEYLSGALRSTECQLTKLYLFETELSEKGVELVTKAGKTNKIAVVA